MMTACASCAHAPPPPPRAHWRDRPLHACMQRWAAAAAHVIVILRLMLAVPAACRPIRGRLRSVATKLAQRLHAHVVAARFVVHLHRLIRRRPAAARAPLGRKVSFQLPAHVGRRTGAHAWGACMQPWHPCMPDAAEQMGCIPVAAKAAILGHAVTGCEAHGWAPPLQLRSALLSWP